MTENFVISNQEKVYIKYLIQYIDIENIEYNWTGYFSKRSNWQTSRKYNKFKL